MTPMLIDLAVAVLTITNGKLVPLRNEEPKMLPSQCEIYLFKSVAMN